MTDALAAASAAETDAALAELKSVVTTNANGAAVVAAALAEGAKPDGRGIVAVTASGTGPGGAGRRRWRRAGAPTAGLREGLLGPRPMLPPSRARASALLVRRGVHGVCLLDAHLLG